MFELKIQQILRCGANREYLQRTVSANFPVAKGEEFYVLKTIDLFLEDLAILQLSVTIRAADKLRAFRDELGNCSPEATLSADQARRLNHIVDEIAPTLRAEA